MSESVVADDRLNLLLDLIKQRDSQPGNNEIESQLYNDILIYLLSDSSDHWWCADATLPIARESLWLFSLPDHEHIVKYKAKLNNQLAHCMGCARSYHLSKRILRTRYNALFSRENVESFFALLDAFDRQRVVMTLQTTAELSSLLNDNVLCTVCEIICSPHLLQNKECDELFCQLFERIHQTGTFPTLNNDDATGVVILTFHHHRIIRFWARKLLEKFAADGYTMSSDDYKEITAINDLIGWFQSTTQSTWPQRCPIPTTDITAELWKALRLIVGILPTDLLHTSIVDSGISMHVLLQEQFSENTGWFAEILRTVTAMLLKLGIRFWGAVGHDSTPYYTIFKTICEHDEFQSAMRIAREGNAGKILQRDGTLYPEDKLVAKMKTVLEWIFPYWMSLRLTPVEDQLTDKIIDTLFGYFQLDVWAMMCKACCAELGFKVIQQSIEDKKIPSAKINDYATHIVAFATASPDSLPQSFKDVPRMANQVLADILEYDTRALYDIFMTMIRSDAFSMPEDMKCLGFELIWKAVDSKCNEELAAAVFRAYANVATIDLPNAQTMVTDSMEGTVALTRISEIRSVVNALTKMETTISWERRKVMVLDADMVKPLLQLLCSPYPEIQQGAVRLICPPNCHPDNQHAFRNIFNENPLETLKAFSMLLNDFNDLSRHMAQEVFPAVPQLTQNLTYLMFSLVGDEESYLPQSVIAGDTFANGEYVCLQSFWDRCWRTISLIFSNGLKWAEKHKPKYVVDTVIPVFDIADQMIGSRQLFQRLVHTSQLSNMDTGIDEPLGYSNVNECANSLSHWIYVTRSQVLEKLVPLLVIMLKELHQAHERILEETYDRLLTAATGESTTRLSEEGKEQLCRSLRAHEPIKTILIDDSDDEAVEWQEINPTRYTSPSKPETSIPFKPRQTTLNESFLSSTSALSLGNSSPPRRPHKITSYFSTSSTSQAHDEMVARRPVDQIDAKAAEEDVEMDEFDDIDFSTIPDEWFDGKITTSEANSAPLHESHHKNQLLKASSSKGIKPTAPQRPKTNVARVFPQQTKNATYAVTSTGRKLKQPSMGFSKMKALREEFRAERRMNAAVRSPSAAAVARARNGDDDSQTSDSESSDDDDDGSGLLGLVQDVDDAKASSVDAEKASMKALFEPAPKRTTKLIDSSVSNTLMEKRARAQAAEVRRKKVTPDIDRLYKAILSWNIMLHSEIPPNSTASMYTKVKDKYTSFQEYLDVFEPLLLLEVWMQLVRAKESLSESDIIDQCSLDNRCHVNDFVDVTFKIALSSINGLSQDDLVCIGNHFGPDFFRPDEKPFEETNRVWKERVFLGKVVSITQKKNVGDVTVRCYFTHDRITLLNGLAPKTKWRMLRITSLTTTQREYAALAGLEHYDLSTEILAPSPSPVIPLNEKAINKCIDIYGVNRPQAEAIVGVLQKKKGFNLIQGPPGTGKTKTILGLIVSLMDERASRKLKVGSTYTGGKLLVCAPSNAAVDEIAKRLKDGVVTADGLVKPNVIRIGVAESVNSSVRDLTLDRLIDKEVVGNEENEKTSKLWIARREKLNEDMQKCQLDIDEADREIADAGSDVVMLKNLRDARKTLYEKRSRCRLMLKDLSEEKHNYTRDLEISRLRARQKVFGQADVVCATLSASGHDMITSMGLTFETVIIDEAAQSIEISTLIPLKYDCQRCVLVGDPNQLPPTVLSLVAAKYQYEQSLFMRLQHNAPNDVHLLRDGPEMANISSAIWHTKEDFPPYRFFHIDEGREKTGYGKSIYNVAEAEAAVALVDKLASHLPMVKFAYKIGVITPYKQQLSQLKLRFERRFGSRILDVIDFNTVDGFQGQEKDIIIFSCVRAGSGRGIGFLADIRRMNVGLTRAKRSLFVLGHAPSLKHSQYWGDLVQDATERGVLVDCRQPYFQHRITAHIPQNLFQAEESTGTKRLLPERSRAHQIAIPTADYTNHDTNNKRRRTSDVTQDCEPKRLDSGKAKDCTTVQDDPMENHILKITTTGSVSAAIKGNSGCDTNKRPLSQAPVKNAPIPKHKMTLAEYRASMGLPPLNSSAVNTTSVPMRTPATKAPNLFIPKNRRTDIKTPAPVGKAHADLSARERIGLEHDAAKKKLREIREEEARRSSSVQPNPRRESLDSIYNNISRHR
ncbi:DEAD-box type RNA helicase [Apophysomyces sp. BC1034]|nr:DEAD-box type RNA helicase [Apophysomyces sp. BC1034]